MSKILIISYLKGGFGNQLQQYSTGLAIARKLNAEYKVDLSFFNDERYKKWYKLDNINVSLKLANSDEIALLKNKPNAPFIYKVLGKFGIHSEYRKKSDIIENFGFKPDKRLISLNHSAYITGWCSASEYVREIRTILIEQFKPKNPLSDCAKSYLDQINCSESVSIHIRRGDFLDLQHFFRIIPIEYYKIAVKEIFNKINNPKFFIFSNDLEWAKNNINFIENPVFVDFSSCENYNILADIEEFELMKHCNHNIIANSSFSWWAAYLNVNCNKIVIAPHKWFNDKFYQTSFEKFPLCPSDWLLL